MTLALACPRRRKNRRDVGHRLRDVDVEEGRDGSLWMLEDANPGALFHVTPKVISSR